MDNAIGQLEQTLRALIDAHQAMFRLLQDKRQAVRTADHRKVAQLCQQENQCVARIAELERKRLKQVAELTLKVQPDAQQPMRLIDLAQNLEEPMRGRLLVTRQQLRQEMEKVRHEASVVRRATDALLSHMDGFMRSVGAACTGVATYSHQGKRPDTVLAVSTFSATA